MTDAIFTTVDAARAIGCTPRTVRRWCRQLNVGKRIGGAIVLTTADVAKLARHVRPGPGQPPKGERPGQSRK